MANDMPQTPDTKQPPVVNPVDKATSGQIDPKLEADEKGKAQPVPDKAVPFEKAKAPAPEVSSAALAEKNAALEKEQAALLSEMDSRAAFFHEDNNPKKAKAPKQKPAPVKKAQPPKAKPAKEKPAPAKEDAPAPEPEQPPEPKEAPRKGEKEQIVFINLTELHAFKNHPFAVRNDEEMAAMVGSVKDKGVTQPAIVRPREGGGYEMVSGHRRQKASELAGFVEMPCIVRNLTDEQAITQMVEDNTNQRENIFPSERAKALKMQLEAIKRQGARDGNGNGQRSNEIVAERNKMTVKQVQRYIKLNELVPDLRKMVDDKKIGFTSAVELAFIKPKNQRYIAVAIEGQQSAPSLSQAQRLRELDQKNLLLPDTIDGIMLEEKKEVDKVIISSQELGQYFGKDKTPREMKDQILQLLDQWKGQQKDLPKPEKKQEAEK